MINRFFTDSSYRSRIIYSTLYAKHYLQFSNFTESDRYPDLFRIAQAYFEKEQTPKILSFGCSTGEEVGSLLKYLPQANIIGVDINKWCIRQAKSNYKSNNLKFIHSLSEAYQSENNFDAIFALAVFQHPENRHRENQIKSAMNFNVFENQLAQLNNKLKPGGLLFLDQLDFNFLETQLAKKYKIYPNEYNMTSRERPIFNSQGIKTADRSLLFRVFQKK